MRFLITENMKSNKSSLIFMIVIASLLAIYFQIALQSQNVPIGTITWSPDDTKIAISTIDTIEIRDSTTNALLLSIMTADEIVDLAWSPSGNRLAGSSSETSIYIWDSATGEILGTLTEFDERHSNLEWHPTGNILYSLGLESEFFEWDTTNFTLITSHDNYIGGGRDLEVSPNGAYLAIGIGRAVQLYNLNDWSYSIISTNHTNEVFSVSWNNDNNRIASGDFDGNIFVWEISRNQETFALNRTNNPQLGSSVPWLTDRLLSNRGTDGIIRIWDTITSEIIYTASNNLPGYAHTYAWNNARTEIAYGTVRGSIIIETLNYSISSQSDAGGVLSLEWSPNGEYIAYGYNNGIIEIFNPIIEDLVFRFDSGSATATTIAWSPNSQMLSASIDKTVYIWENLHNLPEQQPRLLFSSTIHQTPILSFAWNSLNSQLASLSEGGNPNLVIWDVLSGEPIMMSGISQAYSVSWNCLNDYLITGAGLGIRLIEINTGDLSEAFGSRLLNSVAPDIACSPDGTKIAVSSNLGEILVYDISNGSALLENQFIVGDLNPIVSISWNSSGNFLAGASVNGTVRVWNILANTLVDTIIVATDNLFSIDWNPLANEIVYGGDDGLTGLIEPNLVSISPTSSP